MGRTKNGFYQTLTFLIRKRKVTHHVTESINSDLYFPHPSGCSVSQSAVLGLTQRPTVIGRVYTSVCTAGPALPDLLQVEPSRMLLDKELRQAIQEETWNFGLFCLGKRESEIKFNNMVFNKYIMGDGPVCLKEKSWLK